MFPIQPSQSSATSPSGSSAPRASVPPAYIFDAVVDGEAYHLPAPEQPPIGILLLDGSVAQLSSDKVVLRGQTMDIPSDLGDAQEISSGGQLITAQPGPSKKPEGQGSGGGGGGGLFGAIGKALGGAASAVKGVADVGKGAMDLATGTGSSVAGDLANTVTSATGNVGNLVSSLNGIQEAFPLGELSQAGLDAFSGVQNLGRGSLDWMKSLGKLAQGFDKLSPEVQKQARDNIQEYAKPGGQLEQAQEAMRAFEEFPWESEAPATQVPTATGTPQPTDTASDSQSRTTTIASSTEKPEPTERPSGEYIISSKPGTSLETFKKFTQELNSTTGEIHTWDTLKTQMYITNLTAVVAEELPKQYAFIQKVYLNEVIDESIDGSLEEFRAVKGSQSSVTPQSESIRSRNTTDPLHALSKESVSKLDSRALTNADPDAPWWKKMISALPRDVNQPNSDPSHDPPYLTDDSGGKGTTIYVLDDGFDLDLPDLAPIDRQVGNAFAPNTLTLSGIDPSRRFIAGIGGGEHGTMMAVIAGGKILGIAPNTDLYLVKTKNRYRNSQFAFNGMVHTGPVTPGALQWVLNTVQDHILQRLDKNDRARSVINMSWGRPNRMGEALNEHFETFFQFCDTNGIPVVLAAGNLPSAAPLHENTPQRFGTATNSIITVGAVRKDGTLWPDTAQDVPGTAGSLTVFAPGEDIEVPTVGGRIPDNVNGRSGTSQAAAMVSGLVAFYYSWPALSGFLFNTGEPTNSMKQLLTSHAWTRVPAQGLTVKPPNHPPLTHLNVIYNLARGDLPGHNDLCFLPAGPVGKRQNNCPNALPSASSTLSTSLITSTATSGSPLMTSLPSTDISSTTEPSLSSSGTSPPIATPEPVKEQCRIAVAEFDDENPDNHEVEEWNIRIYPFSSNALLNNTLICERGASAEERTGVDMKCPHLGNGTLGIMNVRREANDALRFIWGDTTWTGDDERCILLSDWHDSPITSDERKRETECRFDCQIDAKLPPFRELTR
ncbi:peptidase S8/S53 domain-containing protein [Massariosphaeria phaeospora]|uniref:Peptidase S8/S53 domain-containing protein n=1 Tax=Massariosphaeria phaeospora TaxID=100035 RepID=A0A7C8III7_9PLEO|nr:peptidase S8/S53 domain-containing protein [Massariosphaeria phaeospora]